MLLTYVRAHVLVELRFLLGLRRLHVRLDQLGKVPIGPLLGVSMRSSPFVTSSTRTQHPSLWLNAFLS